MRKLTLAIAVIAPMLGQAASAEDTIKIGYIDPLSGGGASVGEGGLKTFQYLADELNAKGGILGHKIEILPLDNKTNPQESLVQAQKAIDAGAHFITQGNGSSVGAALEDFVTKHNTRNPGKEVLYFNYAAVDPSMTNDKCSYWHFRWDASSDIKMEALTNYMKGVPSIKKVYLINQDYSFGQSVRSDARKMLAAKRPDVQIVGDELHPLLKVTDFSPYIAKIKASGADSVVTGNWGQDIALLLKAAADAGLQVDWYTYYAGGAAGYQSINALPVDANGQFDVMLSAKRPGGYTGPWWPLLPTTNKLLMRMVGSDWAKERDPAVSIERVDRPVTRPRTSAAELQARLERLPVQTGFIAMLLMNRGINLRNEGYINKLKVMDMARNGGLVGQFYYEGAYELTDNEALIVEAKVPAKCHYSSILLTNAIYETTDWTNNHSSLNDSQARPDADGVLRVVISAKDPGVANWLDTAGYPQGVVQGRWMDCDSQPVPSVRKVALADVHKSLPPGTRLVTPAERDRIIRDRRAAFQQRPLW